MVRASRDYHTNTFFATDATLREDQVKSDRYALPTHHVHDNHRLRRMSSSSPVGSDVESVGDSKMDDDDIHSHNGDATKGTDDVV